MTCSVTGPDKYAAGLLVWLVGPGLGPPPYAAAVRWPCIKKCYMGWKSSVCTCVFVCLNVVTIEIAAGGTSNFSFLPPPTPFIFLAGSDCVRIIFTGGEWLRLYTNYFYVITGQLLSEYCQLIGLMPLVPNSLALIVTNSKKCVFKWNLIFQYNLEDLMHHAKINSQLKVKTSRKRCQSSSFPSENFTLPTVRRRNLLKKTWASQSTLGQLIRKEAHSCSVAFQVPSDHLAAIYAYLSRSRLHNDESIFVCANVWECSARQNWEIQNVCSLFALSHHFHWLQRNTELGNSTLLGIVISQISKKHHFIVWELCLLCDYLLPPTLLHISLKLQIVLQYCSVSSERREHLEKKGVVGVTSVLRSGPKTNIQS